MRAGWSATTSPGTAGPRTAPYALTLVGSSASIYREAWSVRWEVPIERDSTIAAAQAVFFGTPISFNLTPSPEASPWRGILALPVELQSTGSAKLVGGTAADTLTIGAITLNSTRRVKETDADAGGREDAGWSILTRLDAAQLNQVVAGMSYAAAAVLLD